MTPITDTERLAWQFRALGCGSCGCPGYCDDYQTYNLRPSETGGSSEPPAGEETP